MQAQHNLSKVLRDVAEGQRVTITRRREKVAEIVPVSSETSLKMPDFAKRARNTWGSEWHGASTDELLDESRGSR
jgi:prevent-host-death family protein